MRQKYSIDAHPHTCVHSNMMPETNANPIAHFKAKMIINGFQPNPHHKRHQGISDHPSSTNSLS
jgi:hypothetical protein